jgi:hypothetical protein
MSSTLRWAKLLSSRRKPLSARQPHNQFHDMNSLGYLGCVHNLRIRNWTVHFCLAWHCAPGQGSVAKPSAEAALV